jgi:hypothetical protein
MNFTVVISILGLIGLFVVFYGPWQSLIVDTCRQVLFQIRDEIFDKAADGDGITFDTPVYVEVRRVLNSMIRHCHDFTWIEFLVMMKMTRSSEIQESALHRLVEAIEDEELQDYFKTKVAVAAFVMIVMAWLRSPFLLLMTLIVVPFVALWVLLNWSGAKELFSRVGDKVQEESMLSDTITRAAA